MKKLNKILTITCLAMLALSSCNTDFLETKPLDEISSSDVFTDPDLAQAYINGIYLNFHKNLQKRMKAVYSDEGHRRDDSGALAFNRSQLTADVIPSWAHEEWGSLYQNIRRCNLFLDEIQKADFEKDSYIGEVRFLRAWLYHRLASLYGGVPIISKSYQLTDDLKAPRNSYEEVVKFIVDDCDAAASALPDVQTGLNNGRATKGAALALKARTLLYAASDLHNTTVFGGYAHPELLGYTQGARTDRWTAAKNAAKAVIDMNLYNLYKATPGPADNIVQNYVDVFIKKQTEEDIWVRFETPNTTGGDQNLAMMNGPNGYDSEGNNAPSANLVDAFEMKDGTKFSWTNPQHASAPYQNREPRLYANILYEGARWQKRPAFSIGLDPVGLVNVGYSEKWNAATGTVEIVPGLDSRNSPFNPWNSGQTLYLCRKMVDESVLPTYDQGKWQAVSWRYFRYAEILLNYAEACIELGEDAEARRYINMVRTRAGLPGVTEIGAALRARYRNERRIELMYEDHRFFDVRRWVIGPEGYGKFYKANVTYKLKSDKTTSAVPTIFHEVLEERAWLNKAYFFPIMRDELNKNEKLIQNPDY
ncbi:RagB/SusD family nutrient uptake outer membrane protein [Dyadobacter bucti]|uniref:RagB/SusD family nutrient uptake outer membrane protein n=1 Tax=Dyadobacter bucti TaxID=2572203 RepID=UPI003F72B163